MATNDKITRKELIEDKAFLIGKDYAKSLDPALKANKEWLETMIQLKGKVSEFFKLKDEFKISPDRAKFLEVKKQEELTRLATAKAIKAEQEALISKQKLDQAALKTTKEKINLDIASEKSKQSLLDTEKKSLDIAAKKERAQKKVIKLTAQEKLELQILNRNAREAAKISSKLSTEYEKQATILIRLKREYKDVALREGEASTAAKRLRSEIIKLDSSLKRVDASVGEFQRNVGNYTSAMNGARNAARSLASAMGLVGGAFLIVQVVRDATKVIREFEKQNATLSAILQVEKEEMRELTQDAQRLGETTVKTASQVSELQIAYARLGFNQKEIIDLTEGTIAGSIAMNAQLDNTANLTGAVVNTFEDLSTTDAPRILDILSLATAKSALNFQKLEVGIPIVAGAADASGIPFTKLVALMGKLADSGIDVSTSSTALRNIFIESAAQGANYEEVLEKIKGSQDKLTASNDEFGKRAAVSAAILSKNIDATNELDESLNNAAGTAQRMAEKELATLDGSLKLLRSAFEGYILSLNDSTGAGEFLRESIGSLAKNFKEIINSLVLAGKIWIGYKTAVLLARIQQSLMNKTLSLSVLSSKAAAVGISKTSLAWANFNKVLKANALGIAVAALYALYEVIQFLNVPLSELIEKTNESTEAFISSTTEMEAHSSSLGKAAERYDELTEKTSLNKKEQKELDDIIKLIAKDVPGAVTEIDKYGNALSINTEKVREFNKENALINKQLEKTLLEENIEQLKRLEAQQTIYNNALTDAGEAYQKTNGIYIEGIGTVVKLNNEFVKRNKITGQNISLTSEQVKLVQKTLIQNEADIKIKKDFIETLTSEGRERIRLRLEKENQLKIDAKLADQAGVLADGKASELLSVTELRVKIKDLNKEKLALNKSQISERIEKDKLIKIYQAEIDAILGITKANKSAEKLAKDRLKAEAKLSKDLFKLRKFELDAKIESAKEGAKNDLLSFELRQEYLEQQSTLEIELEEVTARHKLDLLKKYSDDELDLLIKNGELSIDSQKKLSNEEILILQKLQLAKAQIKDSENASSDDLDVAKLKADADKKVSIKKKELEDELRLENEFFQKEFDLLDDKEKAIEDHEKRVAEIKLRYAKEGLQSQISALEQLILISEEGSKERIKAEEELATAKRKLSDITTEKIKNNDDEEVLSTEEKVEQILAISQQLSSALGDLADALIERKIQGLEIELERNDEKYNRILENENLTENQRKEIEAKQKADREKTEKEIAKQRRKQAVIAKAQSIVDIGIATALGIMQAYAQTGPIAGTIGAALIGALGAIQIAAVVATPIPQYYKGTDNHAGGLAEVAEYRPEVIQEPGKRPYLVSKRSILDLPKGTTVTPSLEEYQSKMRYGTLNKLKINSERLSTFNHENAKSDERLITEMQLTRKAIEKNKTNVVVNTKVSDIPHELFRFKNTNWDN